MFRIACCLLTALLTIPSMAQEQTPHQSVFDAPSNLARNAKRTPNPVLAREAVPSPIEDGVAMVSESNTVWNPTYGVFQSLFKFPKTARLSGQPVTELKTDVGQKVAEWYLRGTGAGLKNHLYDNHDGDHSNMRQRLFLQLDWVEFSDEAKRRNLNLGLQLQFFYNAITIGNSSQALTHGPYWRSLPRMAYTSPRNVSLLYMQYTSNHLYVYPEHKDHDIKMGDLFASNTPYVLISQGSSGSDRRLLEAVGWTLASFQPKTKQKLAKRGALMAAVQMVFRRSNKRVQSAEDYLSGKAHPTVFDGETIDELRLINLAHEIKPDRVPPVAELRVVEEDEPVLGVDYFDDVPRVKLFDTPAAISRLQKSTQRTYRMVVSAEPSYDLNNRPLTYYWRVLRGDSNQIQIKPLNEDHSLVEIIVPFQERRPIEPGSEMTSSRVDIGAFVFNGTYYSAPAFISFQSPTNEIRKYNQHGDIESVEYRSLKDQYSDPLLTIPRTWTDQYAYDENQNLIGWTRTRKSSVEKFTAQGALITQEDGLGRASEARSVIYRRSRDPKQTPPTLQQLPGSEVLHYRYDSPTDKTGRVVKRTPVSPDPPLDGIRNAEN